MTPIESSLNSRRSFASHRLRRLGVQGGDVLNPHRGICDSINKGRNQSEYLARATH